MKQQIMTKIGAILFALAIFFTLFRAIAPRWHDFYGIAPDLFWILSVCFFMRPIIQKRKLWILTIVGFVSLGIASEIFQTIVNQVFGIYRYYPGVGDPKDIITFILGGIIGTTIILIFEKK